MSGLPAESVFALPKLLEIRAWFVGVTLLMQKTDPQLDVLLPLAVEDATVPTKTAGPVEAGTVPAESVYAG